MMQHVCSDEVQNAEASEHSDGPCLERRRWSPGVGASGNCHIQIAFSQAFEIRLNAHKCFTDAHHWYRATPLPAKPRVSIALVDGTPLLPTAEFKIGCCPSASRRGERYRRVDSRAIRQMSYFVAGKQANVEGPAQQMAALEISAETQSQPWRDDRQSRGSHASF
ncbi:hypothetical protein [Bradyrhizobium sp. P5_C12]